jgi:hypothetical protein
MVIAPDVGFQIDRELFERVAYYPYAHEILASEQNKLRKQAIELLDGTRKLKMEVTDFPSNPTAVKAMSEFHTKLASAVQDGSVKVNVTSEGASHDPSP